MAGRKPAEAVRNYLEPLQRAVSCVTDAVLRVSPDGYKPAEKPHALFLNYGDPVRLDSDPRLFLTVEQQYRIVEAPGERGPWKVRTAAYNYSLEAADAREVIAYHWHPEQRGEDFPHVHVRSDVRVGPKDFYKYHLPTGRVALEEVLRLVMAQLEVGTKRPDWRKVLTDT